MIAFLARRRAAALRRLATALLADPDARHYGYPLSRAAGVRSGTLYPILSRWEGAGWLDSGWDDGPYPRRRHYTLTPAGREAMAEMLKETP